MSKPESIKSGGWFFIAGSFAFITILSGSDPLAIPGSVISTLLLAVGMLSLRAGYGENVSRFGRNILLLGVIGPSLLVIVIAAMTFMYGSGNLTDAEVETKGLWIGIFGGPAVVLPALTLFGLAAPRNKSMARMNWLPVFAGIWYPVVYFFLAGYLFTHNGKFPQEYYPVFQIIFLIQFLALCALGAFLVSDATREVVTI
jgi:hypothetical protein